MSLALFVGEVGMSFVTHYCQGDPVDSKHVFAEGDISCSMMDAMEASCDMHDRGGLSMVAPMDCCDNEVDTYGIGTDYLGSGGLSLLPDLLVSALDRFDASVLLGSQSDRSGFDKGSDTGPPLPVLSSDHFSILFQVFRI